MCLAYEDARRCPSLAYEVARIIVDRASPRSLRHRMQHHPDPTLLSIRRCQAVDLRLCRASVPFSTTDTPPRQTGAHAHTIPEGPAGRRHAHGACFRLESRIPLEAVPRLFLPSVVADSTAPSGSRPA